MMPQGAVRVLLLLLPSTTFPHMCADYASAIACGLPTVLLPVAAVDIAGTDKHNAPAGTPLQLHRGAAGLRKPQSGKGERVCRWRLVQ